ncbi:MAG TPA: hypothetical protein VFM31_04950, partial [Nitrososphaeraceae archaeon]|nr:hypothetical protein [Nitrososphaeraceae archaeon]
LFCFITGNKEFIEHIKRYNLDIDNIIIYKPIWLNELRVKVNSLISNQQHKQQKEDKLLMMMAL